jgi:hypothetical protein
MSIKRGGEAEAGDLRRARDAQVGDDAPASGCPPTDAYWEAWRSEIPDAEFARLVEHTAGCASCARASRAARDLVLAGEPERYRGARRAGTAAWARRGIWAAAAVLSLALAGLTLRSYLGRPGVEELRTREESGPHSPLDESQPLRKSDATLRWTPGPVGASYSVVVTDESLQPVASTSGLDAPQYRIPREALDALPAGTRLVWQVETILPDGRRLPSLTFFARLE